MIVYLWYYLLFINIVTFFIYAIDKYCAIKNKWRIKERTLHCYSLLGGSIGALIAMKVFNHKVSKPTFYVVNIFFLLLYGGLFYYSDVIGGL